MRAVVFDMDGLMFNTEDVYTLVGTELLRRRGREFTAELKNAMMGLQPQSAFETMIAPLPLSDTWQELAAESNRLFLDLLDGRLAMMPGLVELLDALGAGRHSQGDRHQQSAGNWSTPACSPSICASDSSSSLPPKTSSTASRTRKSI